MSLCPGPEKTPPGHCAGLPEPQQLSQKHPVVSLFLHWCCTLTPLTSHPALVFLFPWTNLCVCIQELITELSWNNTGLWTLSAGQLVTCHKTHLLQSQLVYKIRNLVSRWKWKWTNEPFTPSLTLWSGFGLGVQVTVCCRLYVQKLEEMDMTSFFWSFIIFTGVGEVWSSLNFTFSVGCARMKSAGSFWLDEKKV